MTQSIPRGPYLVQGATQAQAARAADAPPGRARADDGRQGTTTTPTPIDEAAIYGPIPRGGGRMIVEKDGNRTIITSTAVPPQMLIMARRAQETAFGLLGLLGIIVILGPFARAWARRLERRADENAVGSTSHAALQLQQQLLQLQQSVDAMSVEVERISESQRFQSRLLHEKQELTPRA